MVSMPNRRSQIRASCEAAVQNSGTRDDNLFPFGGTRRLGRAAHRRQRQRPINAIISSNPGRGPTARKISPIRISVSLLGTLCRPSRSMRLKMMPCWRTIPISRNRWPTCSPTVISEIRRFDRRAANPLLGRELRQLRFHVDTKDTAKCRDHKNRPDDAEGIGNGVDQTRANRRVFSPARDMHCASFLPRCETWCRG